MTTTTNSPWRSADQVAADLGVEVEYVRRQCKKGVLPGKKLGNKWRIHTDDVEAFMRDGKAAPAAQHKDTKKTARQQRGGRATVGGG